MSDAAWSPAQRGSRLRVDVGEVLVDSKAALAAVLQATPGWGQESAAAAVVEHVSGAMTNLVYRCSSPATATTSNATVIVRVFGQGGKLFSQKDERNIFLLASELGLGPKCLVEFENGRVEEFLPGDNLSCGTMQRPEVSAAIAQALAVFHVRMLARLPAAATALSAAGEEQQGSATNGSDSAAARLGKPQHGEAAPLRPAIYQRIRQWHAAAQDLCAAELQMLSLGSLLQELEALEARLAALHPSWVGFCHNDLQYGNMLLFPPTRSNGSDGGGAGTDISQLQTPPAGEGVGAAALAEAAPAAAAAPTAGSCASPSTESAAAAAAGASPGSAVASVKLIDYEYSTLNDVGFDVANHFCEWAYNYHSDEAHVFQDARLPNSEQQLHFCHAYVAAMQQQAADAAEAAGPPTKRRAVDGATVPAPAGPETDAAAGGSGLPAAILASSQQAAAEGNGGGADACEQAALLLLRKAEAHLPLVHLKWGLWGLIQDKTSDVDFDYLSYGQQRIQRYHATKQQLLGVQ